VAVVGAHDLGAELDVAGLREDTYSVVTSRSFDQG
jgi:hypothetical protein